MSVETINPATEERLAVYDLKTPAEIETLLTESSEAFTHWRKLPLEARLGCVEDFERCLNGARHALAELMTKEMGKTLKESLAEVDKCIVSCKTLRELFPKWIVENNYELTNGFQVTRQPLGVVLGIMPWNFPLWQAVRFMIPALLCGNTVLLKHAPCTFGSALFIEDLMRQAFPHGVYLNLQIEVATVQRLIADARVRGVSLTGSRQAGIQVGQLAAASLKKCVLELGGSDAYVLLDDADVELAAETCATSRLINNGQSCVAAKRFIVTKKNASLFISKMKEHLQSKAFGDPFASATHLGPMARQDLRDGLHEQVLRSVREGARLDLGGVIPAQKGYFYPPTLLTKVKPGVTAFEEELFGPVASIIEAETESQALRLANRSRFGLGGAIFSRDVERARALATEELEAGMIAINAFVQSDATSPFGGVKDSGLGRELGREGSFEFTNIKTIYLKP